MKKTYLLQIVKAGATGDCMFFIASGTVCVTTTNGRELCHLEDGDHFGEVALILKNNKARVPTRNIIYVSTFKILIFLLLAAHRYCHGRRILRNLYSRLCQFQEICSN